MSSQESLAPSAPTRRPPSTPGWAWFGAVPLAESAEFALREHTPTWVKNAYHWLYLRLDEALRSELPSPLSDSKPVGPPAHWVPVLGALRDDGRLGFVVVEFGSNPGRSDAAESVDESASEAAEAVARLFRQLDPTVGYPRVGFEHYSGSGSSADLSVALAAAAVLLGGRFPADAVATGCLETGPAGPKILPVEPSSLPSKIKVARRFGYRRLFVAEDQHGIPADSLLEIIHLPRNLLDALFAVFSDFGSCSDAVCRLLAVFDQTRVRWKGGNRDEVLRRTEPFITDSQPAIIRRIGHDMRSRALLHAGETARAQEERAAADAAVVSPKDFPSGFLGAYLKWQQPAHNAVLAIDLGYWTDEHPDHQRLDRTLNRLTEAIEDGQAGPDELLAALFLANTRARRRFFLGRWRRQSHLLREAWNDLVRFHPHWEWLFDYAAKLGLPDTTLRRQHNQCIECATDYARLHGRLPEWDSIRRDDWWPARVELPNDSFDAFDLVAWLHYRVFWNGGLPDSLVEPFLAQADLLFEGSDGYPHFLPYEAILRANVLNPGVIHRAAVPLAQSLESLIAARQSGILALLAWRTAAVLDSCGIRHSRVGEPDHPELRQRWFELSSEPSNPIDRCPY